MQWLVDLIIEKIGVPPCFYDRGDPTDRDFKETDLTLDNTWRDLDLSAIIPNEAQAVLLDVLTLSIIVNGYLEFRRAGNSLGICRNAVRTQVAGITNEQDIICACKNRHIEYRSNLAPPAPTIRILVKGWWK